MCALTPLAPRPCICARPRVRGICCLLLALAAAASLVRLVAAAPSPESSPTLCSSLLPKLWATGTASCVHSGAPPLLLAPPPCPSGVHQLGLNRNTPTNEARGRAPALLAVEGHALVTAALSLSIASKTGGYRKSSPAPQLKSWRASPRAGRSSVFAPPQAPAEERRCLLRCCADEVSGLPPSPPPSPHLCRHRPLPCTQCAVLRQDPASVHRDAAAPPRAGPPAHGLTLALQRALSGGVELAAFAAARPAAAEAAAAGPPPLPAS